MSKATDFDPESATIDAVPDEYQNLLRAATQRALESDAVRAITAKFEQRLTEMQSQYEAFCAKVDKECEEMRATCDGTVGTMKEHEKRIHQLASRPPPKDNSGVVADAMVDATGKLGEKLAQAVLEGNQSLTQTLAASIASLVPQPSDDEEDDDIEDEAPPEAPKRKPYRFNIEYDLHNRMIGVDAIPRD